LLRNPNRGGQGPYWAVEPYDDDVVMDEVIKMVTEGQTSGLLKMMVV
jgi:hypothetical protein